MCASPTLEVCHAALWRNGQQGDMSGQCLSQSLAWQHFQSKGSLCASQVLERGWLVLARLSHQIHHGAGKLVQMVRKVAVKQIVEIWGFFWMFGCIKSYELPLKYYICIHLNDWTSINPGSGTLWKPTKPAKPVTSELVQWCGSTPYHCWRVQWHWCLTNCSSGCCQFASLCETRALSLKNSDEKLHLEGLLQDTELYWPYLFPCCGMYTGFSNSNQHFALAKEFNKCLASDRFQDFVLDPVLQASSI